MPAKKALRGLALHAVPAELLRAFEGQAVRDVRERVEVQVADVGVVAPLRLSQQRQHAVRGDWNQSGSYDDSAVLRRARAAVDGPDVHSHFTSGVCEEVVGDAFERVDEARQNARFGRV